MYPSEALKKAHLQLLRSRMVPLEVPERLPPPLPSNEDYMAVELLWPFLKVAFPHNWAMQCREKTFKALAELSVDRLPIDFANWSPRVELPDFRGLQTVEADYLAQVRFGQDRAEPDVICIAASVQASQRNILHTVFIRIHLNGKILRRSCSCAIGYHDSFLPSLTSFSLLTPHRNSARCCSHSQATFVILQEVLRDERKRVKAFSILPFLPIC